MTFPIRLDSAFCVTLALTFAHFLWQGLLVAALAWLAGAILRRRAASLRYGACVCLFGLMALAPPLTFIYLQQTFKHSIPPPPAEVSISRPIPKPEILPLLQPANAPNPPASIQQNAIPLQPIPPPPQAGNNLLEIFKKISWQAYAPWIALGYFAGVLAMLVRLTLALRGGHRLSRRAQPLDDPLIMAALERI